MSEVVTEIIWTLGGGAFVAQQFINVLFGLVLGAVLYKHHVRREDCDSLRKRISQLECSLHNFKNILRWSMLASKEDKEKLVEQTMKNWDKM